MSFNMVPEYPKKIARVGAVMALLGSLIWVQWPIDLEKFNFSAVILLVASFMTWVSVEMADTGNSSAQESVKSEDVEKMNSLLKFIDKKQFYVLKNRAIETYMNDDDYNGLRFLIGQHEDDIFPFHNKKLQAMYERFCADSGDFCNGYYEIYSYDGQGRMTWRPAGDRYVDDETYKTIRTQIAALDRKASKLAKQWEDFVSIARQELKGASKTIERYDM